MYFCNISNRKSKRNILILLALHRLAMQILLQFITATLTIAIFLLSLFSLKKKGVLKALFVLSIITVVISLLPLMYGLNYYTLVGAFITVTLVIESIFG